MSSYEAKNFRIGEPIDSEVAKHIELLQDVFGTKDGEIGRASCRERV